MAVAPARILNCQASRATEEDWGIDHAHDSGAVSRSSRLPLSKDLRTDWWTVGNQGETGSCVGWAVADGPLRWHLVKAKRLPPHQRLSTRFAWMAAKEMDQWKDIPTTFIESEGTSIKAALDVARKFGAVHDDVIPFNSSRLYRGDFKTFYALAARLKITSYFGLHDPVNHWREWLATNGPLVARLEVDDSFNNAKRTSAVLTTYEPAVDYGAHAVVIVGYTKDHFVLRSSWGRTWGDGGFVRVSDDYAAAAISEAYGLTL